MNDSSGESTMRIKPSTPAPSISSYSAPTGGEPGKTSEMSMGSEPLRAVNESLIELDGNVGSLQGDLGELATSHSLQGKMLQKLEDALNY